MVLQWPAARTRALPKVLTLTYSVEDLRSRDQCLVQIPNVKLTKSETKSKENDYSSGSHWLLLATQADLQVPAGSWEVRKLSEIISIAVTLMIVLTKCHAMIQTADLKSHV